MFTIYYSIEYLLNMYVVQPYIQLALVIPKVFRRRRGRPHRLHASRCLEESGTKRLLLAQAQSCCVVLSERLPALYYYYAAEAELGAQSPKREDRERLLR